MVLWPLIGPVSTLTYGKQVNQLALALSAALFMGLAGRLRKSVGLLATVVECGGQSAALGIKPAEPEAWRAEDLGVQLHTAGMGPLD